MHGRIDIRIHVRTDANTQVQTWKLEVRSKKLEVRNKKCRASIDKRTHVLTNIWTHEHARGQRDRQTDGRADRQTDRRTDGRTDGWTDGLTHTPSRTRAWKHTNACIDERTHVRSNIWMHEHARGQTDGRTHTYALTYARMHTHERYQAYTHTRCTQVHMQGRIDIRIHVSTEANTQVQTWK